MFNFIGFVISAVSFWFINLLVILDNFYFFIVKVTNNLTNPIITKGLNYYNKFYNFLYFTQIFYKINF